MAPLPGVSRHCTLLSGDTMPSHLLSHVFNLVESGSSGLGLVLVSVFIISWKVWVRFKVKGPFVLFPQKIVE